MVGPRLTLAKVQKVQALLNMQYRPAEIAEELGVSVDAIYRTYLPEGAPCEVDNKGLFWINGPAFANWSKLYLTSKKNKPKAAMADVEAYCVKCNKVVVMINPHKRDVKKGVARLVGHCPVCGKIVNRFMRGLL